MASKCPNTSGAPLLRRQAELTGGRVSEARLYVSALGVYDAYVNGRRVPVPQGDGTTYELLTPGWTNYDTTVNYFTYDVTDLLADPSQVTLAAVLGNGWYNGRISENSVYWSADGNSRPQGETPRPVRRRLHPDDRHRPRRRLASHRHRPLPHRRPLRRPAVRRPRGAPRLGGERLRHLGLVRCRGPRPFPRRPVGRLSRRERPPDARVGPQAALRHRLHGSHGGRGSGRQRERQGSHRRRPRPHGHRPRTGIDRLGHPAPRRHRRHRPRPEPRRRAPLHPARRGRRPSRLQTGGDAQRRQRGRRRTGRLRSTARTCAPPRPPAPTSSRATRPERPTRTRSPSTASGTSPSPRPRP